MKLEIQSINYCVPLTSKQFQKLERRSFLDDVSPKMTQAGATRIDYNGHFGGNVFFTTTAERATAVLETIKTLVR